MIHKATPIRTWFVVAVAVLLMGTGVGAQTHEEIASRTGLAPDLFVELKVSVDGSDLVVFAVYVTERTFESKISQALREWLLSYIGKNALYVNPAVKEVVGTFPFRPDLVSLEQEGKPAFFPNLSDWIEITPGFLTGGSQVNPAGASYGVGSEGILVAGDRIDPAQPFTLVYQGTKARLEISKKAPSPPAAAAPREATQVPLLAQVTDVGAELTSGEFSSTRVASLLGLDPSLVGTISVGSRGEELRLVVVQVEEGIRKGALRPDLLATLEPFIGTGAVMIWALSPSGAAFSPWQMWIKQTGTNYVFFSTSSFVELTEGFLRSGRVEARSVLAGLVLLPSGVRRDAPFGVFYGSAGVTLPNVPSQ